MLMALSWLAGIAHCCPHLCPHQNLHLFCVLLPAAGPRPTQTAADSPLNNVLTSTMESPARHCTASINGIVLLPGRDDSRHPRPGQALQTGSTRLCFRVQQQQQQSLDQPPQRWHSSVKTTIRLHPRAGSTADLQLPACESGTAADRHYQGEWRHWSAGNRAVTLGCSVGMLLTQSAGAGLPPLPQSRLY